MYNLTVSQDFYTSAESCTVNFPAALYVNEAESFLTAPH
uniref:Uncharacterized protein n=1 Tax=Anguilla anguilla TaxID=7936 RepID=A0A0E9PT61_ANGAN